MIAAVNSHARVVDGRREYPTMFGADGWYGWQPEPWNVGALEVWYWSMRPADRARVGANPWLDFLEGRNASYPEAALQRELDSIPRKLAAIRADRTPPDKRLADNMLDSNPAATDALGAADVGCARAGPGRAACSTRACATSIPRAGAPACRRMSPRSCPSWAIAGRSSRSST